ncbi:MAG: M20/M25/M40 family metallo-hydrolase [Candidatus Zhuqueibacterota bacterium]
MNVDEKKLLDLFMRLIRVDSTSLHERAMADFLITTCNDWNIKVVEDDAAAKVGGNSGNLIIRLSSDSNDAPPLALLAHTDTVRSTAQVKPNIEQGVIRSDGSTILGADNRGGVALILYVMQEIIERKLKHRSLEIVFTVAEELGMLGALALDYSQLKSREGYVFDCSAKPGSYVSESPTAYDFQVTCKGRPAHSAVAPEKGINAVLMSLDVMNSFPVGRLNQHTVANIGTIQGGTADNVVPDLVKITGEFRSFVPSEIDRLKMILQNACHSAGQKYGGVCDVEFKLSFKGYTFNSAMPMIRRLHAAMQKLNLVPNALVYSGGSDVNVVNANGILAVNVGIGASNPHSNDEQIAISDMAKGAALLLHLIEAEEA